MGLSENSVPLHPMVLLIIIPTKWLFHWGYTPFSDMPISIFTTITDHEIHQADPVGWLRRPPSPGRTASGCWSRRTAAPGAKGQRPGGANGENPQNSPENGKIMKNHWKFMGRSWENHGKNHEKIMGRSWKIIGKSWENHWKNMGKTWETHGKIIWKAWENAGDWTWVI